MPNDIKISAIVADVLGKQPNFDNSFITEGGDSFNAIILMERLAEDAQLNIEIEQLLSNVPLRAVLGLS